MDFDFLAFNYIWIKLADRIQKSFFSLNVSKINWKSKMYTVTSKSTLFLECFVQYRDKHAIEMSGLRFFCGRRDDGEDQTDI